MAALHASQTVNGGGHNISSIGASSTTSSKPPFTASTSSRASPFPPALVAMTKHAMAAPSFAPHAQPFHSSLTPQSPYPHSTTSTFDRDAAMPGGARSPFSATAAPPVSVALIKRLPLNTSDEMLRLMLMFSKDLIHAEILPAEQSDDPGYLTAILEFETPGGAQEAKKMLHGKSHLLNDAKMVVEIISASSSSFETAVPIATSTKTSSATSSTISSSQPPRFNGTFQPLGRGSPPMNGAYGGGELANPEAGHHYHNHNMFSPQSPIGNHLTERPRNLGKTLINNDGADDDETGELLKDPVAYAEHGALAAQQRRAIGPQPPMSRMAALTLNTTAAPGPPSYGHPNMQPPLSAHPNATSPTAVPGHGAGYNRVYRGHNFPPVNPADQNPPCNTLYVGNLPIDTAEEELKALFSKQRGYKRLCFRTKQNGPMCFVEFEDITFATKVLNDLYGYQLHNSVKGGIRLSFSKNPLGVRSGQAPSQTAAASMPGMNGMMSGAANGFSAANGPPPGLGAPPGLVANRHGYTGNPSAFSGGSGAYAADDFSKSSPHAWGMMYNSAMAASGPTSMMARATPGFPPHMMGR